MFECTEEYASNSAVQLAIQNCEPVKKFNYLVMFNFFPYVILVNRNTVQHLPGFDDANCLFNDNSCLPMSIIVVMFTFIGREHDWNQKVFPETIGTVSQYSCTIIAVLKNYLQRTVFKDSAVISSSWPMNSCLIQQVIRIATHLDIDCWKFLPANVLVFHHIYWFANSDQSAIYTTSNPWNVRLVEKVQFHFLQSSVTRPLYEVVSHITQQNAHSFDAPECWYFWHVVRLEKPPVARNSKVTSTWYKGGKGFDLAQDLCNPIMSNSVINMMVSGRNLKVLLTSWGSIISSRFSLSTSHLLIPIAYPNLLWAAVAKIKSAIAEKFWCKQ